MNKIIIIGGGAAGMMAAIAAANEGAGVVLLEHNDKLGKKLFITGKGRCNITNACDTEDLFNSISKNSKFMYSSIYSFDNFAVMQFFEDNGLKLKTERGERVFPVSDHSSDVIRTLSQKLKSLKVDIRLGVNVTGLIIEDDTVKGVVADKNEQLFADRVIVATGGKSYATTGSTGAGYEFAIKSGHKVTKLMPSLVPFECREAYIKELQGLSLKNVTLKITKNKKVLYEEFGEMLFTHYGISGPLVLSASSIIGERAEENLSCEIDLKPALDAEMLDKRILRDFDENKNKNFENVLPNLLPSKLISVIVKLSGIDPYKKVNSISREERGRLVALLKAFPATITGTRDFNEAIITKGGVSVKDINPSTMESKIVKNLYFAGEVLDVDAKTGGFNLQIAWSSGYLAGLSAAQ